MRSLRFRPAGPLLIIVLALSVPLATAQRRPPQFDQNTQVRSIQFHFTDTQTFREPELRSKIALTERGSFVGLRNALDFLPFIEPVGEHLFDPLELQRDVVRLRRFYDQAGFLHPEITYDVHRDETENVLDVTFLINEGLPLVLDDVRTTAAGTSSALDLPENLDPSWKKESPEFLPRTGTRLDLHSLPGVEQSAVRWLMDRGYPFARASTEVIIDSGTHAADLTLRVEPGPQARISSIAVTGEQSVRKQVVLRELPFTTGDLFSLSQMAEGRREILSLGLFRQALVGLPDTIGPSDTVPIRVEVTEGPIRQIVGETGYDSRGGLTLQAEWLHRNLTGDARTFSVSGLAQTGLLAIEKIPEILYRGTFTLTQPYVFHRRLSVLGSPYVELRDDYRDKSFAYGFAATLIYQVDPVRSLAFRYGLSDRRIEEARFGEYTSGAIDILTLLNTLAKGTRVLKSVIGLQATYGSLDDITVPRKGYLFRPSAEVTVFPGLNSIEYGMINIPAFGFYPLGEAVGLAARVSAGTIVPFGKGLPQGDETPGLKFLQLRDVVFTAGGPDDARGWGSRLLGPKFPDLRVQSTEPETTYMVSGYIPIGGLTRISFSVEVRLPVPGLGRAAALSLYLDGARVWNAHPDFSSDLGWGDEEQFFFGTGIGFLYRLPVGTFRLDSGLKLNPSYQDLREPSDIINALVNEKPLDQVPANQWKRFHVHLSISVSF